MVKNYVKIDYKLMDQFCEVLDNDIAWFQWAIGMYHGQLATMLSQVQGETFNSFTPTASNWEAKMLHQVERLETISKLLRQHMETMQEIESDALRKLSTNLCPSNSTWG